VQLGEACRHKRQRFVSGAYDGVPGAHAMFIGEMEDDMIRAR
jgi:hypothetical protein